jgi:hypothetical protein
MSVIRRAVERDAGRRYWVAAIGTSGTRVLARTATFGFCAERQLGVRVHWCIESLASWVEHRAGESRLTRAVRVSSVRRPDEWEVCTFGDDRRESGFDIGAFAQRPLTDRQDIIAGGLVAEDLAQCDRQRGAVIVV